MITSVPTYYRHITNCRPTVGHLSANCRPTDSLCFGENLSADCRPTDGRQSLSVSDNIVPTYYRQVTDILPTHHQLSADRRPTVGQQTADSRPTDGQQSADRFFGELFFTITGPCNLRNIIFGPLYFLSGFISLASQCKFTFY